MNAVFETPAATPCAVAVVVATYNEKTNMQRLIPEVMALPLGARMVIVDDNSPDGTAAVVESLAATYPGRVELVKRAGKLGYGSAFVAGFKRALELGAEVVVSMDADFSHDPQSIPDLVARTKQYDVVLGSRYVGGIRIINWSMRRLLLSYFANNYVRFILGFTVTDCTSGFRAYRRAVLESMDLDAAASQGYAFIVELLEYATRKGFRAGEAPIVYTERQEGRSKMSRGVIFEAMLRPWKLRWRRMSGK
jgi:dolichol-phosphate mannosyltransferase